MIDEKFKEISKEQLIQAFENFESQKKEYPDSKFYHVVYKGVNYPPKPIVAIAYNIAFGEKITTKSFNGGKNTSSFKLLEIHGFNIIEKEEVYNIEEQHFKDLLNNFNTDEWLVPFLDLLKSAIEISKFKIDDELISFTVYSLRKRLSINIGNRIAIAIEKKKKNDVLILYITEEEIQFARKQKTYLSDDESDHFDTLPPGTLLSFECTKETFSNNKLIDAFLMGLEEFIPFAIKSPQTKRHNPFIYKAAVELDYRNNLISNLNNSTQKMTEQVLVYEIKSSANVNSDRLFSLDRKYFYWNDTAFKKLVLGDIVFVVNTHAKKLLFTKLDQIDIPITVNEDYTFFTDLDKTFEVSGKWGKFIRLEIIYEIDTPQDWKWKSLGSSETTYLNGKSVNPAKGENRIINIQQLKQLSQEKEYNRILDACLLNFTKNTEELIPEIVSAIQSDFIQNAINEEEFRFQKASDYFDYFKNLKEPSVGFFKNLQEKYLQSELTYTDFVKLLNADSEEYKLIYAIGKLISYIDLNAADKNNLNDYNDKRTLALTGIRQTLWLKNLLEFKVNNDYSNFTPIIKSALTYLEAPTKEIILFSEKYRELVALNLLKLPHFNKDEFVNQFIKFFKPYGIFPKNPLNYNQIISRILYHFPDVEKLWKKETVEVKIKDNSISTDFYAITQKSGLIFSEQLIQRFIASLYTKPFVICSGLSGSGKTKLAQAFAQWICYKEAEGEKNEQYCIVPVGADWTNREPLLGYPNALQDSKYVKPENGVLDLINRARLNETKPYFLILDEMNLSHVERYFADFLSTMESGDAIPLHTIDDEEEREGGIPKQLHLPKNLFIIGTVNIDETTYMFSPKVLDRANTIEFRLTEKDLNDFIKSDIHLDMKILKGAGESMGENFVAMAKLETNNNLKKAEADLLQFFRELKKSGAEFGYRSASEIGRLMFMLESLGEKEDNLLDIAIMQKLLPKLHGSRNKLTKVLPVLGGFCLKNKDKIKEDYLDKFLNNSITEEELNRDKNIKYPISLEKICRMYKNAFENGFASYAEA